MSDYVAYALTASWLAAGALFWASGLGLKGVPRRWRARHKREEGWCDWLLIFLPLSLLGGPLWWLALAYLRRTDPAYRA